MKKTVFISYEFNDGSYAGIVRDWLHEIGVEPKLVTRKQITPETAKESEKAILEYISKASLVLVLVGNNTHNSTWVACEVNISKSNQTPVRWVRLNKRLGGPPTELSNTNETECNKSAIHHLLNSLNIVP
jgi:hypothetical protein